jgi:predicted 3-demethylubiquinone-9 3-methyltransferase (glyoxalase superfamily)
MKSKNTICLWFDKDALENGNFYAATFPNSEVTAVHKAPADYPSGKAGDVVTVEFTVSAGTAARRSVTARRSPSRSQRITRQRRIAVSGRSHRERRLLSAPRCPCGGCR